MKQVFVNGRGEIEVIECPVPGKLPGSVLVRTVRSLISQGTEGAAVSSLGGWLGVYEKALSSRRRVDQVWDLAKKEGVLAARRVVFNKLEEMNAIGYSCAGIIEEVSDSDVPFCPGDRVACMGAGFACHSEYVVVPTQLVAPVPDGVEFDQAAFAAIACIAMQGIRRLELTPGETIVILGLGLIGQVAVQIANALGYRVVGMDLSPEKAQLAVECGALDAWVSTGADNEARIHRLTSGHGADGVVICAGTKSDEPLHMALDLCRNRGRVAVIGDIGLGAEREKMYRKELEIRLSCSYGPGRYDQSYELQGNDYPLPYARWTEGRNLACYLDLLSRRVLNINRLISRTYPIADAPGAYRAIKGESNLYGVLFSYGDGQSDGSLSKTQNVIHYKAPAIRKHNADVVRLGLIGAGAFTRAVHLPSLSALSDKFLIAGVASRSSATAGSVAKRTGAGFATTDYQQLLDNPDIDAVLIATRHTSHGRIVADALQAGKHVFVEKPLAVSLEECARIVDLERETGLVVRVGFNRRFAPLYVRAKEILSRYVEKALLYRVNVGNIGTHWSNTQEEGGRIVGEGCHFFDLFNWFFDEQPDQVCTLPVGPSSITNPNVSFLAKYPSGSTATLTYNTLGSKQMGKEYFEAYGGGVSMACTDFNSLRVYGSSGSTKQGRKNKGHKAELAEFASAILGNKAENYGADAHAGYIATAMALAAAGVEAYSVTEWKKGGYAERHPSTDAPTMHDEHVQT